jgi:hypothetical protein
MKEMMQDPPKGMVRTEMGRLVKKADQDAWEKKATEAMQAEYQDRMKRKDALKSMKKELPAAPPKKGAMDALKAVGKYVSTFGLATEKYNPKPKNR